MKCCCCGEDYPHTHLVYMRIRYGTDGYFCDQCYPEINEEDEE